MATLARKGSMLQVMFLQLSTRKDVKIIELDLGLGLHEIGNRSNRIMHNEGHCEGWWPNS